MRYIVVGGGIAGVSCGKELARLTADEKNVEVFIITATPLLKEVGKTLSG
jgi:glycine/D-amino acid oxidase-like deaminating enzyme